MESHLNHIFVWKFKFKFGITFLYYYYEKLEVLLGVVFDFLEDFFYFVTGSSNIQLCPGQI